MTPPPRQTGPTRRDGFTLVELLVVILILAILIALLVPVIASAVRAANTARVAAEINNMATAMASFKERYGEFPPSRIFLHNDPNEYNLTNTTALSGLTPSTVDLTVGDLNARTVRAMKKFFPRAVASFTPGPGGTPVVWDPINRNTSILLQGHECLVFFLGGMPDQSVAGAPITATGFGKDPVNPFTRPAQASNRTVPLFEFAPGRLQDVFNLGTGPSGLNGFPSYLDPLSSNSAPRPYAYFSSYGNNGYDPNDDNSRGITNNNPELFDDNSGVVARTFYVSFPVVGGARIATSPAPNPYTGEVPDARVVSANTPQKLSWLNPQSFQLLSAGLDGEWGMGGAYDPNASSGRLTLFGAEVSNTNYTPARARERDNIANFQGGKLD